jgi:hypothetical protein
MRGVATTMLVESLGFEGHIPTFEAMTWRAIQ